MCKIRTLILLIFVHIITQRAYCQNATIVKYIRTSNDYNQMYLIGSSYYRRMTTPGAYVVPVYKDEADRVSFILLQKNQGQFDMLIYPIDHIQEDNYLQFTQATRDILYTWKKSNQGDIIKFKDTNFSTNDNIVINKHFYMDNKLRHSLRSDSNSIYKIDGQLIILSRQIPQIYVIVFRKGYLPSVQGPFIKRDNYWIRDQGVNCNMFVKEKFDFKSIEISRDGLSLSWQKYPDDASHFVIRLGADSDTIHVQSDGKGDYSRLISNDRLPENVPKWNLSITSIPFSFIQDAEETRIDTVIEKTISVEEFLSDLSPIARHPARQQIYQSHQDTVELRWSYVYSGFEYPDSFQDTLEQIVCVEGFNYKEEIRGSNVRLDSNSTTISVNPGKSYSWSVHARWKADTTLITKADTSSFFIEDTISTPMLYKPGENDTLNVEDGIIFSWHYQQSPVSRFKTNIQISDNRNFTTLFLDSLVSNSSLAIKRSMFPSGFGPYYWRVINSDSYENRKQSVTRSFYFQDLKELKIANLLAPILFANYNTIIKKSKYNKFVSKLSDTQNFNNHLAFGLTYTWLDKQYKYMVTATFSFLSDVGGSLYLEPAYRICERINNNYYINGSIYGALSGYGLKQYSNLQWGVNIGLMIVPFIHGNGMLNIHYQHNEKPYLNVKNTRKFFSTDGIGLNMSWRITRFRIFYGATIGVGNDMVIPNFYLSFGYYLQ